jgi:membrane fusion protein, multidrug efflux system
MVETPIKSSVSRLLTPSHEVNYQLSDFEQKQSSWQRLIVGGACLVVGLAAATIGISSIAYRLTHATVDGGLVNGRMVRLQTPIDGRIKDFYARPGVAVHSGQVLVRLAPSSQQEQTLLQLQGAVQSKSAQLSAVRQSLDLLDRQSQTLEGQDQNLKTVSTAIASDQIDHYQAAVRAAIAAETAAQTDYQRYQQLWREGAVSQRQLDQLHANWQSAQAVVDQAKADLSSAQTSHQAIAGGVVLNQNSTLQSQRLNLSREIQAQTTLMNTLSAELSSSQQQLKRAQSLYSDRQDLEVVAPFSGVVYGTEHDADEQVSRPNVLLTLLDCNDLWVETLVSAEQASRIDSQKSVRVQLAGDPETFVGEIDLIEAISRAELTKDQAQALAPAVPIQLADQPLARVTVRIPPTHRQGRSNQFCGIGQSARLTFGMKLFADR